MPGLAASRLSPPSPESPRGGARALVASSLRYYAATHVWVGLAVAAATAALTGALMVGDSMRASLRDAAVNRLGRVDHAVAAAHFFREALAGEVASASQAETAPAIVLRGAIDHADSGARAAGIQVLGVDERFWRLDAAAPAGDRPLEGREVLLNEALARELNAAPGDEVLVRLGRQSAISAETLLGRRDETTLVMRLTVREVIPISGLAGFSLQFQQTAPRNAFVSLTVLQRTLNQAERANVLLIASGETPVESLKRSVTLADLGLSLREANEHGYVALESASFLISPAHEEIALRIAEALNLTSARVLTYLANEIVLLPRDGSTPRTQPSAFIPYSTVAAVEGTVLSEFSNEPGGSAAVPGPGQLVLNSWAAENLAARTGDRVRLSYYVTGPFGRLDTRHAEFTVSDVVPLKGAAADPGFTPTYPGVTDTRRISDWDPPFPVDLTRVRDEDEAYWEAHRATPKAFVSLEDGLRLWGHDAERLGSLTSVRLYLPDGDALNDLRRRFEREFLNAVDPVSAGLTMEPIRERAIAASAGNTDFGMLFIGFSFFLIAAALLLVALLFRLGMERRGSQIGLLLATGYTPAQVALRLAAEGAVVALAGVIVGAMAAMAYSWLMLAGLRTWWSAAVSAPFLQLHVIPGTVLAGAAISFTAALGSTLFSIRGLTRVSPRALLAGVIERPHRERRRRLAVPLAILALVASIALCLLAAMERASPAPAFFGSGAAMLVACLAIAGHLLGVPPRKVIGESDSRSEVRLGIRNARRQRGRSLMTMGLVAASSFVILALEAFRLGAPADPRDRRSGTGGFTLLAESAAPLPYDLNTPAGRESLNMPSAESPALAAAEFVPLRLRPGDETSCLNLYQSSKPRILGATGAMLERGGFRFAGSLAASDAERANPWLLLLREFADGAVPAIGDEAAVKWQLHSGLGQDLVIADERGRDVRLRFVALLGGSMLQSELIVAEPAFKRLFPSIDGYAFFLIDTPPERAAATEQTLERELTPFGFDVSRSSQRLASYLAVQNTYLSTFQTLGGLGLVLGVVGLAAVMLRNVWERRRELALMRALGFSRAALGRVVLSENLLLVAGGLTVGVVSAALAVAPHLARRAAELPWLSVGALLLAVLFTGLIAGAAALRSALRAPLVPALRNE